MLSYRSVLLTALAWLGLSSHDLRPSLAGAPLVADARSFPGLDRSGVQDATAALQAALDAAGGKTLILPPGIYLVSTLVLPRDGITLHGAGARLVRAQSGEDGQPVLSIPRGAENIRLDGLEIDGNTDVVGRLTKLRDALTAAPHQQSHLLPKVSGIVSGGHVTKVVIRNMSFHDLPQSALEISDGDADWEVSGNRIKAMGRHGIVVDFLQEQAHHLVIRDNHVEYCALAPISIIAGSSDAPSAGAADVSIVKNFVSHNGLDINGYSPNNRDIVVSKNTIIDNGVTNRMGHAIHFAGTNLTITGNIARNTALSAIVVSAWPNGNPTPIEGFTVSGNTVDGVLSDQNPRWGQGILIQNASSGRISGNRISGTQQCPIEVDGNALGHGGPRVRDVEISGNAISNSPSAGTDGVCVSNADEVSTRSNRFTP